MHDSNDSVRFVSINAGTSRPNQSGYAVGVKGRPAMSIYTESTATTSWPFSSSKCVVRILTTTLLYLAGFLELKTSSISSSVRSLVSTKKK